MGYIIIFRGLQRYLRLDETDYVEVMDTKDFVIEEHPLGYLLSHGVHLENLADSLDCHYVDVMSYAETPFIVDKEGIRYNGKWQLFFEKDSDCLLLLDEDNDTVLMRIRINEYYVSKGYFVATSLQYIEKIGDYYRVCFRMRLDTGNDVTGRALIIQLIYNKEKCLGIEDANFVSRYVKNIEVKSRFKLDKSIQARIALRG